MGFFPKGLKNEFERAVVNEPSVFEPLKFYFTCVVVQIFASVRVEYQCLVHAALPNACSSR